MPSAQPRSRWLDSFQLNGFAILRGFLPLDFVEQLHQEVGLLLEYEYERQVRSDWPSGRGRFRIAIDISRFGNAIGRALTDDRFRRNPMIESIVATIFGQHEWTRGWTQVEACWRGSNFMGWHSDQHLADAHTVDGRHQSVRLTYNIPLVDFSEANGAMEILPGSHRIPAEDLARIDLESVEDLHPYRLELRRGDVLLRDGNALHRGTPNRTDAVRPMLDQTYKRVTAAPR